MRSQATRIVVDHRWKINSYRLATRCNSIICVIGAALSCHLCCGDGGWASSVRSWKVKKFRKFRSFSDAKIERSTGNFSLRAMLFFSCSLHGFVYCRTITMTACKVFFFFFHLSRWPTTDIVGNVCQCVVTFPKQKADFLLFSALRTHRQLCWIRGCDSFFSILNK